MSASAVKERGLIPYESLPKFRKKVATKHMKAIQERLEKFSCIALESDTSKGYYRRSSGNWARITKMEYYSSFLSYPDENGNPTFNRAVMYSQNMGEDDLVVASVAVVAYESPEGVRFSEILTHNILTLSQKIFDKVFQGKYGSMPAEVLPQNAVTFFNDLV